ncbi:MAG: hypothetical protein IJW28_00505, partial [Clostridia bacterium]|nr:hypothetical protein [Clostridia bacterium]
MLDCSLGVILFYEILTLFILVNDDILSIKKPHYTYRLIRIIVIGILLYFIAMFFCCKISVLYVIMLMLHITYYMFYLAIGLSIILLKPYEEFVKLYYISKAKSKLKKLTHLKVIAITGSYAKTSVKNILYSMLSTKYSVVMTPRSYNTIFGITKTILSDLDYYVDYFICEMGADDTGDIKKLCNIITPNYAIITNIGRQHLETFKSIDNIINEKLSLYYYVNSRSGKTALNFYNKYILNGVFDKYSRVLFLKKKYYPNRDVCGTYSFNKFIKCGLDYYTYNNVTLDDCGTKFDVYKNGTYFSSFQSKLLGLYNIENIVLSLSLADALCVDINLIKNALL